MVFRKISFGEIFEGIAERAVDIVLVAVYFNLELPFLGRKDWGGKLDDKIQEDLSRFDYQALKRAYLYLKQKGFIQTIKEAGVLPKITQAGQERINRLFPFYEEKRVWDGKIYLVTYDLPVEKNKERDSLRNFLKKIGCGMLQQSIWVTPYNPTSLLKKFVQEQDLSEDLVLVSTVGKNGTIGGMAFPQLLEKVFHLSQINQKYGEFIKKYESKTESKNQLIFQYFSILKGDPQLPFELLPQDWFGREAYRLFLKVSSGEVKST